MAVVFIQGVLVEGLRFLGDWRSLLFGALILLVMLVRPGGVLGAPLRWPAVLCRQNKTASGAAPAMPAERARHA